MIAQGRSHWAGMRRWRIRGKHSRCSSRTMRTFSRRSSRSRSRRRASSPSRRDLRISGLACGRLPGAGATSSSRRNLWRSSPRWFVRRSSISFAITGFSRRRRGCGLGSCPTHPRSTAGGPHPGCTAASPRPQTSESAEGSSPTRRAPRTRNSTWAELMRRVFAVDVLECPHCHGRMRILAAIHPPDTTRKILEHLGLPSRAPPIAPAMSEPEPAALEAVIPSTRNSHLPRGGHPLIIGS